MKSLFFCFKNKIRHMIFSLIRMTFRYSIINYTFTMRFVLIFVIFINAVFHTNCDNGLNIQSRAG
jgi:hypothetical protein